MMSSILISLGYFLMGFLTSILLQVFDNLSDSKDMEFSQKMILSLVWPVTLFGISIFAFAIGINQLGIKISNKITTMITKD
jgi:amino acid transporter